MEYCFEPGEIARRLSRIPIEIKDGMARVPQEPGLGVEPRTEVIEKYLVRS
jgi:L-alanine-DL-glutamate epimerase-like enolase superfamily enzyme